MIEESVEIQYGNRLRLRVAGVCIRNQRILLINHSGLNSENEFWAPPGGGLHFGESAIECLHREFREETGLQIKTDEFIKVIEYVNPPLHAIELFFKVTMIGGTMDKGSDPEVSNENQIIRDIEFLSFEELLQIPERKKHSILKGVKSFDDLYEKSGYSKYP